MDTFASIYQTAVETRQARYAALLAGDESESAYTAHDEAYGRLMRLDGLRIDAAKVARHVAAGRTVLLVVRSSRADVRDVYAALVDAGVQSLAVDVATPDTDAQCDEIVAACTSQYDVIVGA